MKKRFERIRKISEIIMMVSIFAGVVTADSEDLMIPFLFVVLGGAAFLISKVCEARVDNYENF